MKVSYLIDDRIMARGTIRHDACSGGPNAVCVEIPEAPWLVTATLVEVADLIWGRRCVQCGWITLACNVPYTGTATLCCRCVEENEAAEWEMQVPIPTATPARQPTVGLMKGKSESNKLPRKHVMENPPIPKRCYFSWRGMPCTRPFGHLGAHKV